MSNIITGLIGVIIGGILSWISNKWVQNNSIKKDIEIKTADKIGNDIIAFLEKSYEIHNLYKAWVMVTKIYISEICDKRLGNNVEIERYKQLDNFDSQLLEYIENISSRFEKFEVYIDVKEIVLKEYSVELHTLFDSFYKFLISLDDLHQIHVRYFFISEYVEKDFSDGTYEEYIKDKSKEIQESIKVIEKRVDISFEDMLRNFRTLNDQIQNNCYGNIFKRKRSKKVYEVSAGKIEPVEKIYTLEKAKQIYKDKKIKRKL